MNLRITGSRISLLEVLSTMKDRLYILLFALVSMLVLAACQSGSQATQTIIEAELVPTPTQTPTTIPVDRSQYEETFDMIWDTVNEMYFDPTFNGVDWESVRDRYRSKVLAAEDDETFYITLNEMCFELGVSHIAVIPADSPEQLEPVLSAPGSVGIDVRLIDDQVVIAWVEPGSPAEQAGLRTGFIILEINGQPVEDSEDLITFKLPPFNERRYRGQFISAIQSQLNGEVGEEVALIYMDDKDQMHEAALTRQEREVQPFIAENLPPFYVDLNPGAWKTALGTFVSPGSYHRSLKMFWRLLRTCRTLPGSSLISAATRVDFTRCAKRLPASSSRSARCCGDTSHGRVWNCRVSNEMRIQTPLLRLIQDLS